MDYPIVRENENCFLFFLSWQIAYLPKYRGFVIEEEKKNRLWIFISSLCHKPPWPFFSLFSQWCRIKWQIEPHFCFLLIILIKWPFHSEPKAAYFRMSRQRKKNETWKILSHRIFPKSQQKKKKTFKIIMVLGRFCGFPNML